MYNSKEKVRDYNKEYKHRNKEKVALNQKRYVARNKEKVYARIKIWRSKKRDRMRELQLKYVHGITLRDYERLSEIQNHCCAICGEHKSKFKTALCVDHNHETDFKRGLLCKPCNLILGNAKDSIEILKKAIIYLETRLNSEWCC